jgi:V-type H+-transporting ATPase subunit a
MREIKRCDELERKLRYFGGMLDKHEIRKHDAPELDRFLDDLDRRTDNNGAALSPAAILDQLEVLLEEKESELINLNGFGTSLLEDFTSKVWMCSVVQASNSVIGLVYLAKVMTNVA